MENQRNDQDFISYLADGYDDVLSNILSRVPTISIITASCVSRKWFQISHNYLENAKALDFGKGFVRDDHSADQVTKNVKKIISMHKSEKIDSFKLVYALFAEHLKKNFLKWMRFATDKEVQELDLDFCGLDIDMLKIFLPKEEMLKRREAFQIPSILSDCSSLKILKLRQCILVVPQSCGGFSRLNTLCLDKVYVTDEMLESMVSIAKLLEVLVVKKCDSLTNIRILSPNLKRLTVYECNKASSLEILSENLISFLISSREYDIQPTEGLLSNLRNLILLDFSGTSSNSDLVSHFLKRAPLLETLLLVEPQTLDASSSTIGKNQSVESIRKAVQPCPTLQVRVIGDRDAYDSLSSIFRWHYV